MLGLHRGALDDGQQVALHALRAGVARAPGRVARVDDLVDLVDEHDAVLLRRAYRLARHRLAAHDALRLGLLQPLPRLRHAHLAPLRALALGLPAVERAHHGLEAHHPAIQPAQALALALAWRHLHLHLPLVQRARAVQLPERVQDLAPRVLAYESSQDDRLCLLRGGGRHALAQPALDQADSRLHQVLDYVIHVAPHIAQLRVLGGLHLDEGRVRQLGQTPRDLRLAAPRGTDHEDVLGRDLLAQLARHALAAPPVAERHRHRLLGVTLPDNEAVQALHHCGWCQLG
mmetsp:Transcript_13952/g.34373  ORF Transcript_13952/g.34373 Transcript_13952/m.34373 type:complete len:288 (-) Transcript_13952:563-1426(-)